jgi:IS30 family transposase
VLKKELLEHLRARRTIRRSKHASLKRDGLGQMKNAVSISERPASIEDRAVNPPSFSDLGRAQLRAPFYLN